jgi:hypothetical protein
MSDWCGAIEFCIHASIITKRLPQRKPTHD